MKRSQLFSLAASVAFTATMIAPSTASAQAQKLLLTTVVASPTQAEFAAVYNPGTTAVDLTNFYLSDSDQYFRVTTMTAPSSSDFIVRFPAGASIAPQQTIYVSIGGAVCFQTACGTVGAFTGFGFAPDYEIASATATNNSATVPDMLVPFTGASGSSHGLTNGGEPVVLFYWDGTSTLITDVDYVYYGTPTSNPPVNKTGILTYLPDTADAPAQHAPVTVSPYIATCRSDMTEGTMVLTGGNGVGGRDETSEPTATTWTACATPIADTDLDGVRDAIDNCVTVANASQLDTDADGLGDACDTCPTMAGPASNGGCPIVDAGVDAGVDAAADVIVDVPMPTDVVVDTGTDVPVIVDTGVDVVVDTGVDVVADTGVDAGTVDTGVDASADVAIVDVTVDAGLVDAGSDAMDVPAIDASMDSGGVDAAAEAGRDAGADVRGDVRVDVQRDAVGAETTEMNRGCACSAPGHSRETTPWTSLAIGAVAIALASRRRRTNR